MCVCVWQKKGGKGTHKVRILGSGSRDVVDDSRVGGRGERHDGHVREVRAQPFQSLMEISNVRARSKGLFTEAH